MIEENKRIVLAFFDLCFNRHQPKMAAKTYLGEPYIQHNPQVANGIDAFVRFFESFFDDYPHFYVTVNRIIAEKDIVVLHVLAKKSHADAGEEVVEFFRMKNGKIVEHWDVISPIIV